ncbi:HCc2 [Symbiodinium microadriaticum]|nr:HCc2 [Symbiodinium microadriaticum]
MHPHWDHTCRGQPFKMGSAAAVEFQVMEGNVIGRPTFCGAAQVSVEALLGDPTASESLCASKSGGSLTGPVMDLELRLPSQEVTGRVFVQALLVSRQPGDAQAGLHLTRVDPNLFDSKVERLGVSGGSAAFFRLCLREPTAARPVDYFIGKDLSHAEDEVNFYEEALSLRHGSGLEPLLGYTLEYAGVLNCTEELTPSEEKRNELLVMRNLRCGCSKLRLLDIKIGQKTAQAGWQGKSRAAALRQSLVDGITNSSCEGFRLEGFDGRPPALESMDPLLDIGMTGNAKMAKKALRVMLQRMTAAEMLVHFWDVHQEPVDIDDASLDHQLCTTEVAELVAHEVVRQLAGLSVACRRSPVPQKWIGSSVGLGFDCGRLPSRSTGEEEVRRSTQVHTFDWGRSELNTMDKHMLLSEKDQHDRGEFWRYYMGGVDRLAWEAARAYKHRFSCTTRWSIITFKLCDFDSMSENDFIGRLTVPVEETPETTADLSTKDGNHVVGDYGFRGSATLTYAITWRPYPRTSRLIGSWRVHLKRAQHLPRQDKMQLRTTSDPMCEITACAETATGLLCHRQVSSVKVRNLDPEWEELFDLPIAAEPDNLEAALEAAAAGLASGSVVDIFPPEKMPLWQKEGLVPRLSGSKTPSRWSSWTEANSDTEALEKGIDSWRSRLDVASATVDVTPSQRSAEPIEEDTMRAVQRQVTLETAQTMQTTQLEEEDKKWVVRIISEEERERHQSGRVIVPQASDDDVGMGTRLEVVRRNDACSYITELKPDALHRDVFEAQDTQPMCWSFSSCATCLT